MGKELSGYTWLYKRVALRRGARTMSLPGRDTAPLAGQKRE
jgi:hypothetical protein